MAITEHFKSSLSTRDIYVKQSSNVDVSLLENAGFWFPLIRIGDVTLSKADIVSFEYSVGASLLPTCNFVINDDNYRFREVDLSSTSMFATIYISNNQDKVHAPIKQEHICLSIDSSSSSQYVSISTVLYVPEFYSYISESYESTSIELCKSLAKVCGLGFCSNVSTSNDSQVWLITKSRFDGLLACYNKFTIDMDDIVRVYIDQYSRLCYISTKTSLTDTIKHSLLTHPTTGEALSETELILSNKKMVDSKPFVPVENYTITQNVGRLQLDNIQQARYDTVDHAMIPNTESTVNIVYDQTYVQPTVKTKLYRNDTNLHPNYLAKSDSDVNIRMSLTARSKMQAVLSHYIPDLLCSIRVPLEFEYFDRSLDQTTQSDATVAEDDRLAADKYAVLGYRPNDRLSKNWTITSLSFSYRGETSIKTNLTLIET